MPSRLEIDEHLDLGRKLNRQISGLVALEDTADIHSRLTMRGGQACCIAHQAAGIHKFACTKDGRERVSFSQFDESGADPEEEGVAGCCARAANGQITAPPSSVMKSRRFIRSPRRRAR